MGSLVYLLGSLLFSSSAMGGPFDAVDAFCDTQRALCEHVAELRPIRTRAGHYRFTSPQDDAEIVAWAFLHRLGRSTDSEEIRSALVPHCGPLFHAMPDLAVSLYEAETQPMVRTRIVAEMQRIPGEHSVALLKKASVDSSPEVREVAAAVAGYHPDFERVRSMALELIHDVEPRVRSMSLRAIGWRGERTDFDIVVPYLSDASSVVRAQAVSSLQRLDTTRLVALPQFQQLVHDSDPKISHMVNRLINQSNP